MAYVTLPANTAVSVYRTVKAKPSNQPLATEGARLLGGRWHPKGFSSLYTTSSPALALVELLVHQPRVKYEKLPKLLLVTLHIPNAVTTYPVETLPAYWHEESYERPQWILSEWLSNPMTLIAAVPSVVVAMSDNYLIHPAQARFNEIEVVKHAPFSVERR